MKSIKTLKNIGKIFLFRRKEEFSLACPFFEEKGFFEMISAILVKILPG
jgi:hypothetical protein